MNDQRGWTSGDYANDPRGKASGDHAKKHRGPHQPVGQVAPRKVPITGGTDGAQKLPEKMPCRES